MWSLGCILGEMIRQKPLFQGTSTINQVNHMSHLLLVGELSSFSIADREDCQCAAGGDGA